MPDVRVEAQTVGHSVAQLERTQLHQEPEQVKKLRQRFGFSQPVFTRSLNSSELTIEKLEPGQKGRVKWLLCFLLSFRSMVLEH